MLWRSYSSYSELSETFLKNLTSSLSQVIVLWFSCRALFNKFIYDYQGLKLYLIYKSCSFLLKVIHLLPQLPYRVCLSESASQGTSTILQSALSVFVLELPLLKDFVDFYYFRLCICFIGDVRVIAQPPFDVHIDQALLCDWTLIHYGGLRVDLDLGVGQVSAELGGVNGGNRGVHGYQN